MNYFTEYKDIKELTRDVVVKLICEVRVSENKEVEIVFDFDDCYKQLLESVEKLGYQVDKEPGGQLNISRRVVLCQDLVQVKMRNFSPF